MGTVREGSPTARLGPPKVPVGLRESKMRQDDIATNTSEPTGVAAYLLVRIMTKILSRFRRYSPGRVRSCDLRVLSSSAPPRVSAPEKKTPSS